MKAKHILLFFLALGAFFAFKPQDFDHAGDRYVNASFTASSDTITDAEIDTIYISNLLYFDGAYYFHVTTDSLSGTDDLTFQLQASTAANASASVGTWVNLGSSVQRTSDGTSAISGTTTYGLKHRLLVTGGGTQSTVYTLTGQYKY